MSRATALLELNQFKVVLGPGYATLKVFKMRCLENTPYMYFSIELNSTPFFQAQFCLWNQRLIFLFHPFNIELTCHKRVHYFCLHCIKLLTSFFLLSCVFCFNQPTPNFWFINTIGTFMSFSVILISLLLMFST